MDIRWEPKTILLVRWQSATKSGQWNAPNKVRYIEFTSNKFFFKYSNSYLRNFFVFSIDSINDDDDLKIENEDEE